MTLDEARALLPEARQLSKLASAEWCESYDTSKGRAEVCLRDGLTGEIVPIAHILTACPYDDRQLMIKTPRLLAAALFLLDIAFDKLRAAQPPSEKKKDYAAECAMKCANDGAFRRFLMERTNLHDASDSERIKTHVRFLLRVESLGWLNDIKRPEATQAWLDLRASFDAWRKAA